MPNPYEDGYRPAQIRPPEPASDDAALRAALEASRSSAAREAALRQQREAEEMRRLAELHEHEQREKQRLDVETRRKEEEQLRRVLEESKREEALHRSRTEAEEQRILEESRRAAEDQVREEEAEIQRVMETSLREEWGRRREEERWEQEMMQRAMRELAADRNQAPGASIDEGDESSASSGNRKRRPLPHLPQAPPVPARPETVVPDLIPSSGEASASTGLGAHVPRQSSPTGASEDFNGVPEDNQAHEGNPFADSAEAPPDYESIRMDRPPAAQSRAPTGFWDDVRAQRFSEEANATATRPVEANQLATPGSTAPAASMLVAANPDLSRASTSATGPAINHAAVLIANATLDRSKKSPKVNEPQSLTSSTSASFDHESAQDDSTSTSTSTPSQINSSPTTGPSAHTGDTETPVTTEAASSPSEPSHGRVRNRGDSDVSFTNLHLRHQRRIGQRAPVGIDWGYSDVPFALSLREEAEQSPCRRGSATSGLTTQSESILEDRERFPSVITLTASGSRGEQSAENCRTPYFTVRCGSWKLLLRSLAWIGNTRIDASTHDESAESRSSSGLSPALLRIELEFVTPQTTKRSGVISASMTSLSNGVVRDGAYGISQYPADATLRDIVQLKRQDIGKRGALDPSACVSICLSLVAASSGKGHTVSISTTDSKNQRELDMEHLKRGSSRKVLVLPPWTMGMGSSSTVYQSRPISARHFVKAGLDLPCTMLTLAEQLKAAHRFSASCPSSGYTARHSPRNLYHCIEAHDEKYLARGVAKQMASLASASLNGGENGASDLRPFSLVAFSSIHRAAPPLLLLDPVAVGTVPTSSGDSALGPTTTRPEPWGPLLPVSRTTTGEQDGSSKEDGDAEDFPAGENASTGAAYSRSSHLGRMKDRVRRKWKGRQGDIDDDDLANWITPLDLDVVGEQSAEQARV